MLKRLLQKSGYYFRKTASELISQAASTRWLSPKKSGKRILLYHGIDIAGRTDINGRFLSVTRFEQQMKYFQDNFQILPLSELFSGGGDPDSMKIAICFDDGYRNNLSLALPVLEKLKIPATFFITAINDTSYPMLWADYLDLATYLSADDIEVDGERYYKRKGDYWHSSGISLKQKCKIHDWTFKQKIYTAFPEATNLTELEEWKPYWETLTDKEIVQLAASPYATIGLHAYYHDNLGILPSSTATQLIKKGKAYLENLLQQEVSSIAYADGSYTRSLIEQASKLGLKEQYAVDYLFQEDQNDQRMLSRLTINPFTSLPHQLSAVCSGKY